jgi:hypothetical protein
VSENAFVLAGSISASMDRDIRPSVGRSAASGCARTAAIRVTAVIAVILATSAAG